MKPLKSGWPLPARGWGWVLLVLGMALWGLPSPVLSLTPTPTPEEEQPPAPPGPTYTVQPGDTLAGIALRFNVSLEALMRANGITDPGHILPGTRLLLPGLEGVQGELTTVELGWCEDLWSLARRYGLTPQQLARLNRVVSPLQLYPGRNLVLPQGNGEPPKMGRYLMAPGETWLEAALRTGQNPWTLALVNQVEGPWALQPGDVLLYPDAQGTATMGACPPQVRQLRTRPERLVQGQAWSLELEWDLKTGGQLLQVQARWRERDLPLFPSPQTGQQGNQRVDAERWVGLQGVHAMARPQLYPLELTLTLSDGRSWSFVQPLKVYPGEFYFEELMVPPEFLDQKTVQEEGAFVREIMAKISPKRRWNAAFLAPIEGGAQCITSYFGTRRKFNDGMAWGYHAGVDFCGGEGTPIYAPAAGKVVLARSLVIRGNAVILDHGWGVFTGYWHMSKLAVEEGQDVQPGDLLGYVGGTGRVTGPHLHWELWVGGVPVDPLPWLQEALP